MTWLKSIGALIAGMLVVVIGSEGTDFVLRALHIFPPLDAAHAMSVPLYLAALLHRILWGVAGCFVAAKLAPRAGMTHALILGGIGTVLNVLGLVAMWQIGDHWYPAALAVTALPAAWLGGVLARPRA